MTSWVFSRSADDRGGEHGFDELGVVLDHQRDTIASPEAHAPEGRRKAARVVPQLAVKYVAHLSVGRVNLHRLT